MSELQTYYRNFCTGYWADPDADKCRCKGHGYALSEVDTWHACPYHHKAGQKHPEDERTQEEYDADLEAARQEGERRAAELAAQAALAPTLTPNGPDDDIPF